MDDFDDSSNSSTEKRKKRPLRNRENQNDNPKGGLSRKTSETKLFGLPLGVDLRERCDQGTQTITRPGPKPQSPAKSSDPLTQSERTKIIEQAKDDAKVDIEKELDTERRRHQVELRKVKRKQWCTICLKEARYFCCSTSFYCSQECQRNHWQLGHSDQCKKKHKGGGGGANTSNSPARSDKGGSAKRQKV